MEQIERDEAAQVAAAVQAAARFVLGNLGHHVLRGEDEMDAELRLLTEADTHGAAAGAMVRAAALLTAGLHAGHLPEAAYDELVAMAGREKDRAYVSVLMRRITRGN